MDTDKFLIDAICLDAALQLDLPRPQALAAGEAFALNGVTLQLVLWQPDKRTGHLFVDIGMPAAPFRLAVYEALLRIQMMLVGEIDGTFVLAEDGRLMFSVRMPRWEGLAPGSLANLLANLAEQAMLWRDTLMAGKFEDPASIGRPARQLIPTVGFLA